MRTPETISPAVVLCPPLSRYSAALLAFTLIFVGAPPTAAQNYTVHPLDGPAVVLTALRVDGETLAGSLAGGGARAFSLDDVERVENSVPSPASSAGVEVLDESGERIAGSVARRSDTVVALQLFPGGPVLETPFSALRVITNSRVRDARAPTAERDPRVLFTSAPGVEETVNAELLAVGPRGLLIDTFGARVPVAFAGGPRILVGMSFPGEVRAQRFAPGITATLILAGGSALTGRVESVKNGAWTFRHRVHGVLELPEAQVRAADFHSDNYRSLAGLEPVRVESRPLGMRAADGTPALRAWSGPLPAGGANRGRDLVVHARSLLSYAVPLGFTAFRAEVGAAPGAGPLCSVRFLVLLDDGEEPVFDSGVLRVSDAPRRVSVPLGGARRVTLAVESAGDGYFQDLARWRRARFARR